MNARARALTQRLYAPPGPAISRFWGPALIALCLGSWAAAIAVGRLIIQQL
jgi:hypothetical protein